MPHSGTPEKKTLGDIYILAQRNPIVSAGLALYNNNIGKMPMFDALVAMVCALAEQNETLVLQDAYLRANTPTPHEFVIPNA